MTRMMTSSGMMVPILTPGHDTCCVSVPLGSILRLCLLLADQCYLPTAQYLETLSPVSYGRCCMFHGVVPTWWYIEAMAIKS